MFAFRTRYFALGLLAALLVACGGGGDDDPEPTGSTSTLSETTGTSVGGGPGIPTSFQEVQPAVIQIVAQGTFRDPEVGQADGSGAGSGFIISADGLAVTNNHVVAGAATIEVFIGGDDSKGYNASVVGVSECSDLALIDIREDEPLPYLDWYGGEVSPGLKVYAAGFPLGDPEFTLTSGIISKARGDGESDWSSLDYALEHDANTQGGNSGGPIVTEDGKVVGIHYASSSATNTSTFYAVPGELAQDVITRLKEGDYEAIGINGWAVYDESVNISGIWVASVAAGSPAAKAEIKAGDIITSLNELPMALDGTMADYCDVFRTVGEGAPMTVEVLRYDTGEVLRGEINGETPLEAIFSPSAELEDQVDVEEDGGSSAAEYTDYVTLEDDTGRILVDVPASWTDIDTAPAEVDGQTVPYIAAATNLDGFIDTYETPGMVFVLFPGDDVDARLQEYAQTGCTDLGTVDYSDPIFTGKYQIWDACGGTDNIIFTMAAVPPDGGYTAFLLVQVTSDADLAAVDEMFATFNIIQ